jgi:hypothetical protein
VSFSAGATFDVGLPIEPSLSVGFWRDQAGQNDVARVAGLGDERFTVTMIPLTAEASYLIEPLEKWKITPLIGAGGSLRWIRQGYEFEPTTGGASPVDQSDSGWGTTAHLSVGARRPAMGQSVQFNLGYVFGSYRTLVPVEGGVDRERTVSFSGLRVGVSVLLNPSLFRRAL